MSRRTIFMSVCISALLGGCVPESGQLAENVEATALARATYNAHALKNYALSTATAARSIGVLEQGPNGLASMLCPSPDGNGGLFLAWDTLPNGLDQGKLRSIVIQGLGSQMVAHNQAGVLWSQGHPLTFDGACTLPPLAEGQPVVAVPVQNPAAISGQTRVETETRGCPDGSEGTTVYTRRVTFSPKGQRAQTEWELADLGKCLAADKVEPTVTAAKSAAWTTDGSSALDVALQASGGGDCRDVSVSRTHGKNGEKTGYAFNTCATAAVAARAVVPDEPESVKPPERFTGPTPPCPASNIVLPSMGSVAEYEAALAPYLETAKKMDAACAPVTVSSVAHWPYWQTFSIQGSAPVYCDWQGKSPYGGRCAPNSIIGYETTDRPVTRLFKIAFLMTWKAGPSATAWTERHYLNWGLSTNFRSFPVAFRSDAEHWMLMDASAGTSVRVWTMDGRGYPAFVEEHTAIGAHLGYGMPYPYPNETGDPWANVGAQAAYNSGISWNAFGGSYHYEVTGAIR